MNTTGMLIQMQRQISSPNARQKHERNIETDTDGSKLVEASGVYRFDAFA